MHMYIINKLKIALSFPVRDRVMIITLLFVMTSCIDDKDDNKQNCLIMGDSTIAPYVGQKGVAEYMEELNKCDELSFKDISYPGDKIASQRLAWLKMWNKDKVDYIFIQVGLNDLYFGNKNEKILSDYQSMINTIRETANPGIKIYIATMVPTKSFWVNKFGETKGKVSYEKWVMLNDAIMGKGESAIKGVDGRINIHTGELSDENSSLREEYDTGDRIHENNEGRKIIAQAYSQTICEAELCDCK